MSLNHILLFVALVSPIAVLIRSQRTSEFHRTWRAASAAVLIATVVSWFFFPKEAGFIGGGAWFALLLLPAIALRKLNEFALCEQFGSARRVASFLALVHPSDAIREQSRLYRALEFAERGEFERAIALLSELQAGAASVSRQAVAYTFRLRQDWEGLLDWCRREFPSLASQRDSVLPLYFRALGETYKIDDLILQSAARTQMNPDSAIESLPLQLSLLALWAFAGNKTQLVRLLQTSLRQLSREKKAFWMATSELAAGNVAAGRAELERLRTQSSDAILRSDIATRLHHADEYARAANNRSVESDRILQRLAQAPMKSGLQIAQVARATPVVITLIVLNVAMFLLEIVLGGSTNALTLHRLGQLETWNFFAAHQYWRLLTSLFLHYGSLHILFNIYALYVLGPGLERSIGPSRFIACYLISGIGSGLGVVLLHVIGLTPPQEVVGASGAIMGVVGAWAGFLLRYRHAPLARRRLQNIVFIVVVQTMFDISTPQISMSAHLCGLVTGLVLGLILAPRDLRA